MAVVKARDIWIKILIGLTLGVIAGLALGQKVDILERVGKAFIDLLKMLVGLIVFSSLVVVDKSRCLIVVVLLSVF